MHTDREVEHTGFKWAVEPVFLSWETWGEICIPQFAWSRQEETVPKTEDEIHASASRGRLCSVARSLPGLRWHSKCNNTSEKKHPVWGQRGGVKRESALQKYDGVQGKQQITQVQCQMAQRGGGNSKCPKKFKMCCWISELRSHYRISLKDLRVVGYPMDITE